MASRHRCCPWTPWALLLLLVASVTPATAAPPPAPIQLELVRPSWYQLALRMTDRQMLETAFRRAGYQLPAGGYLMAARVQPGIAQAAFQYFSHGESGFVYSAGKYWIASTVKLMATVGALWTLHKHGLTGNAVIEMSDADGHYKGPVHELYDKALSLSTNVEYNRLMLIAGYDEINGEYMVERYGTPQMALQRRYGNRRPDGDRELRHSPEIHFVERGRRGVIAERTGKLSHPECPEQGNCASLFELQEVLRRVTLHDEIPPSERFPLGRVDRQRILLALSKAKNKFGGGAAEALGHPVQILCKAGRYPGDDHLDNALIVDTIDKRRYLVAMSVPYSSLKEPDSVTYNQLVELGRQTLRALAGRRARNAPPPLQLDAGIPIDLTARLLPAATTAASARNPSLQLEVHAARATRLQTWIDGVPVKAQRDRAAVSRARGAAGAHATYVVPTTGSSTEHVIVVQALRGRRAIGYRAALARPTAR